jgi:hypothetical protein
MIFSENCYTLFRIMLEPAVAGGLEVVMRK